MLNTKILKKLKGAFQAFDTKSDNTVDIKWVKQDKPFTFITGKILNRYYEADYYEDPKDLKRFNKYTRCSLVRKS